MSRRSLLKGLGLGVMSAGLPELALARADTDSRLVLVILRGAVDGLALASPYGDGNYARLRGELALPAPGADKGARKLDGLFALHPSLKGVYDSFGNGDALLVHAVAGPYRDRSHFDGQDLLETGAARVGALRDGWLNRALAPLHGSLNGSLRGETAIAMAQNTPLVLRGNNAVTSWAPSGLPDINDDIIERLQDLYADDEFFASRLEQALKSRRIAQLTDDSAEDRPRRRRGNDAVRFRQLMAAAARFLTAPDGPRIAVLEFGGWDTHANQGAVTGTLANRFAALDGGLGTLESELGQTWSKTAVAVVTEFGRTVAVNGTRGTDHGTATAALLIGGAVAGGRVVSDWPGLAAGDLYEGRDLKPTTDLRSVLKGILAEHLALDETFVERTVFPDSSDARPLRGLIKTG